MNKKHIHQFIKTTTKIIELLGLLEDMNLTETERNKISESYDNMTCHAFISFDQIMEKTKSVKNASNVLN